MKVRWLNLVLSLTNRIYSKKQSIVKRTGIKTVIDISVLISLEILLGIISLPLYLGLKPASVTAYLEEKGGYDKIVFDYSLRRVLTLVSTGIIFLIWLVKLLLIILVPNIFGPLQLYSVSDLKPIDLLDRDLVISEIQIQTARIVETMVRPELTMVEKVKGGDYIFYGTGQPLTLVVLLLSDVQTVIFTTDVNKDGEWEIKHSQEDFQLSEGNHSVVAFNFDERLGTRSRVSAEQYFKVKTSLLDKLAEQVDVFINFSIIIIIALGILLTVLTI